MKIIRERKRAHPGGILKRLHMEPRGLTITALAGYLGISRKHLSQLVNERVGVTPDMALRLARTLGTTPDLWLNLQQAHDLYVAERESSGWQQAVPVPGATDGAVHPA